MARGKATGAATRWVMPAKNFYIRELDINGVKGVPVELPTQAANRIVGAKLGEIMTKTEAEAATEPESEEGV
jgi:hypothetical protein